MKLVVGDKNLSSWSMRAWLAAKVSGVAFEEILIPLDQPETKAALEKWSPSGKVPCLVDGSVRIWDSLAIAEYFAEKAPHLWPADAKLRAVARSYACEIHSGFPSLRSQLSMDIRLKIEIRHLTAGTIQEIQRILFLWSTALRENKKDFLFGDFGIVDAFYAPVVFRFLSYGIHIDSAEIKAYMQRVANHPAVNEWVQAGLKENPKPVVFS